MDMEKVIKGLETIKQFFGYGLPSTAEMFDSYYGTLNDALALLKEQDELLRKLQKDKNKLCTEISEWKHKFHDRKDQETKPKTFTVIDVKTGEYPDLEEIALHEEWAQGLVYCDMEGFAIKEDGTLLLMDECDNSRYCPVGRFEVVFDEQEGR